MKMESIMRLTLVSAILSVCSIAAGRPDDVDNAQLPFQSAILNQKRKEKDNQPSLKEDVMKTVDKTLQEMRASMVMELRQAVDAIKKEFKAQSEDFHSKLNSITDGVRTDVRQEMARTKSAIVGELSKEIRQAADNLTSIVAQKLANCTASQTTAAAQQQRDLLSEMRRRPAPSALSQLVERQMSTDIKVTKVLAELISCPKAEGTVCGSELVLNETRPLVTLTSPGFPRPYGPRTKCSWTVTTSLSDHQLLVTVAEMDLEPDPSSCCRYDHVVIGDQPPRCGRLSNTSWLVRGSEVKVKFASDANVQRRGFSLTVASVPGCGQSLKVADRLTERVAEGPEFPSPAANGVPCAWRLTAAVNSDVEVTLRNIAAACRDGSLAVVVDQRSRPDVCRRPEDNAALWPLVGSEVTVRYRTAGHGSGQQRLQIRYRARAEIKEVKVGVRPPGTTDFVESPTVPLADGDVKWGAILTKARRRLSTRIDTTPVVLQGGVRYLRGGASRRAVWSSKAGQKITSRDEDDGSIVSLSIRTHFLLHFLLSDSAVRPCHGCIPVVEVYTSARVMTMKAGALTETTPAAFLDPRALVMLRGIEMMDRRARHKTKTFIEISTGGYCDGRHGRWYSDRAAAARNQTVPRDQQQWRDFFVVLKDGDEVPRFRIARGKIVLVCNRHGVGTRVEKRRVRRRGGSTDFPSGTWAITKFISELMQEVTAAMSTTK